MQSDSRIKLTGQPYPSGSGSPISEFHAGLESETQCPLHLRLALSDAKSALFYRQAIDWACSQLLRGHLELGEREEIAGDRKFAATIAFEGD